MLFFSAVVIYRVGTGLRTIQEQKRHVGEGHWYPSKLPHYNGYFDDDSSSSRTLLKCVNLLGYSNDSLKRVVSVPEFFAV